MLLTHAAMLVTPARDDGATGKALLPERPPPTSSFLRRALLASSGASLLKHNRPRVLWPGRAARARAARLSWSLCRRPLKLTVRDVGVLLCCALRSEAREALPLAAKLSARDFAPLCRREALVGPCCVRGHRGELGQIQPGAAWRGGQRVRRVRARRSPHATAERVRRVVAARCASRRSLRGGRAQPRGDTSLGVCGAHTLPRRRCSDAPSSPSPLSQ